MTQEVILTCAVTDGHANSYTRLSGRQSRLENQAPKLVEKDPQRVPCLENYS